jgi:hypothetical protein
MPVSATIRREDVARFVRVLEPHEQLQGVRMAPMAGNALMEIGSLQAAEAFLKPISAEEAGEMSTSMRIHYVDPGVLSTWVRDVIGDAELADGLDEVIATGRVFGLLVPDMKRLIAERLVEYRAALDDQEQQSEQ